MKMIDAWLLATLAIPFAEVVLHTIMDHYRQLIDEKSNTKASNPTIWTTKNHMTAMTAWKSSAKHTLKIDGKLRQVEKLLLLGVPAAFLLFTIVFFITGIFLSYAY